MVQSRRILRRSSKHISSDLTHTSHPNKLLRVLLRGCVRRRSFLPV